jgi:hypothetical protein
MFASFGHGGMSLLRALALTAAAWAVAFGATWVVVVMLGGGGR